MKGNLVFKIMKGKFWFDRDSFVRNLDASVELLQYQSLSRRKCFLFLTEWYFSFLLWACFFFVFIFYFIFFTKDFLPLLIFPWAKIFKFPWAKSFYVWIFSNRDVNKKKLKNESQDERLPRNLPQGIRSGPRLWHIPDLFNFIWNYVFLNNLGAFKDFRNFLWKRSVKMFEFSLVN